MKVVKPAKWAAQNSSGSQRHRCQQAALLSVQRLRKAETNSAMNAMHPRGQHTV